MTRKRFDSAPQINVKDEGMLIQQVAGSTTNLLEVKAHDGATLMAVDYAGTMTSGASNTFTYLAATTSASLPANTTIGAVSPTELGYLDGVTSAIQTQLDAKAPLASPTFTGTVTLPTGTVTSGMILDGTIVNGDINSAAAIAHSKLANATAGQVLLGTTTSGVITATTISGDITISGAGVATIQPDSVALGTDTTGNYVASLVAGTGISLANNTGEGATPTITNSGVTGLTGTANQITVSASTGSVTLSLPNPISLPGRVNIASENLWFGAQTRQMVNLWSSNDATPQYGIGVQSGTQYFRTGANFAWYSGGTHNDAELNAGGGTRYAYLNSGGLVVEGTLRINKNQSGFYQNSTSTWSGNPGAGQGKFEYHSNRWYLASGSDSAEILRVRRDGSDVLVINNDGRISAPFWTTSGRNYCNEWIQFDNHTGLYSPTNGAHFYVNNGSYGAWRIDGTRNTWRGLEFDAPGGNLSLMMDTSNSWGNQYVGVHNNSNGWIYQFVGRGLRTNSYLPISGNNTGQVGAWYGAEGSFNIMYSYGYVNYSDARTKHSVQSLEGGLDFIKRLRPVQYKYIYENRLGYEPDEHGVELPVISSEPVSVEYGSRYRYGFIAQEVKQALEDTGKNPGDYVVWSLGDKEDPESTQQLEYLQFIGPLVAAVQELSAKVAVLEAERGI